MRLVGLACGFDVIGIGRQLACGQLCLHGIQPGDAGTDQRVIAVGEVGDLGLRCGQLEFEVHHFLGQQVDLGALSGLVVADCRHGESVAAALIQHQCALCAGPGLSTVDERRYVDDNHPFGTCRPDLRQAAGQHQRRKDAQQGSGLWFGFGGLVTPRQAVAPFGVG